MVQGARYVVRKFWAYRTAILGTLGEWNFSSNQTKGTFVHSRIYTQYWQALKNRNIFVQILNIM